jgi:hypothetical protein
MEDASRRSESERALRKDSIEAIVGPKKFYDLMVEYYVRQKQSSDEVCKTMKEIHGISTSEDAILRFLDKHGLKRSRSEANSIAKLTLPQDRILTVELRHIIDGLNFGDGSIHANHNTRVARVSIGSMHQEFAKYCQTLLLPYGASEPHYNAGVKGVGMWSVQTLYHRDLYELYLRWSPNDVKMIPTDIEFTPTMILLWYLGDGCLSSPLEGNARYMYFATNCFSKESLERIVVPKFAEIGIEVVRVTDDSRVFIQTNSINKLLQYMGGKSPLPCFDYKFAIEEWRTHTSMHEAAIKANIDYGRLSNWVKQGYIPHERSPGGKKVVFTSEQLASLIKRLDSGELPRESGKKRKAV